MPIAFKMAVGAACAYETAAIAAGLAGRVQPRTISQHVGVRPWIGLPILAGLALHFYWPQRKATL